MLDSLAIPRSDTDSPGDSFSAENELPRGCYWAVAYTHSQSERWAEANLRNRGYKTYLPLTTVRRPDRVVKSIIRRVEIPLFPRYLFVVTDGHWTPIQHTLGVHHLIMAEPGKPGIVASPVLSALQAALAEAATQHQKTPAPASGASVCLARGPFAGSHAVVLSTHRDTARLAVMILGGLRTLSAPLKWLTLRE
jgi:transcription antitermination factor NusG